MTYSPKIGWHTKNQFNSIGDRKKDVVPRFHYYYYLLALLVVVVVAIIASLSNLTFSILKVYSQY